ncbi:STAS domain-containing protein [Bdellovibrionota bacterium]
MIKRELKGGHGMGTKITKQGNLTIVKLSGQLNFENVQPVLDEASKLSKEKGHRIVFNMKDAVFVGSSNITRFIKAIKPLSKRSDIRAKLCCVGEEFRKMFKAFQGKDPFEIFESEDEAINSFDN